MTVSAPVMTMELPGRRAASLGGESAMRPASRPGGTAGLDGRIETTEVEYAAGKVTAKGFLAVPKEEGPHPGVLVVHEWWGNNDYSHQRARMLAEQGYAALAVDMYGDGKTAEHPRDATAFMAEVKNNRPELNARFRAAMKFLQANPAVDREKIAAIGYGFGGNVVLQMARNGTVGLAIGTAGLAPVCNQIGDEDIFGNILEVTEPAVADELAAAASLVMGQAAQACPVVLARGAAIATSEEGSQSLLRDKTMDLFR